MKPENLINWGELSRLQTGNRFTIRKNQIATKYQPFVADMIKAIQDMIDKHNQKTLRNEKNAN